MSKAKSYDLGDKVMTLLQNHCAANYGAPEVRILREAVKSFVNNRLQAEPELCKRFDAARKVRLSKHIRPLREVSK